MKNFAGAWTQVATRFAIGSENDAAEWLAELEQKVEAQPSTSTVLRGAQGALTSRRLAEAWLAERDTETAEEDGGRFYSHILPVIGDVPACGRGATARRPPGRSSRCRRSALGSKVWIGSAARKARAAVPKGAGAGTQLVTGWIRYSPCKYLQQIKKIGGAAELEHG